jgi:hypothetical protein
METNKIRTIESYNNAITGIFKMISFTGKFNIAGSAQFASSSYHNDYDLNEEITGSVTHIASEFQSKFIQLQADPDLYIIDFKCGIDDLFYFTAYTNIKEFHNYLKKIKNMLSSHEYSSWIKATNPDEIEEICRDLYIIRWTPLEIVKGFKALRAGRKKTLIACLQDKSIIKLDIIYNYGNEFIEVSDIYIMDPSIMESTLKEDVKYYHGLHNDFKALKRVLSLARLENDTKTIDTLVGLFNSNIGLINKVKSDFDVIIDVLENPKPVKLTDIQDNLQKQKQMLGSIYQFAFSASLYKKIDAISNLKKTGIAHELKQLSDILAGIIQTNTKIFLGKNPSLLKGFA